MARPLWLTLVEGLTPVVLGVIPRTAGLAPIVADAIGQAEAVAGASGAGKLAHATQLVSDGVAAANAAAGHQVVDPVVAAAVAPAVITTVVGVANSIHDSHAPAATGS